MQPLNAGQIYDILNKLPLTKKIFKGVCTREVQERPPPKIRAHPAAYIQNTGYMTNGIHWVLIYFLKEEVIFFDSFGRPPSEILIKSSTNRGGRSIHFNPTQLQHITSNTCGHWVLYYLIQLIGKKSLYKINRKFTHNYRKNDQIVFNAIKRIGQRCGVKIV